MSFTSKEVSNKSYMDFLISYLSLAPFPMLKLARCDNFFELWLSLLKLRVLSCLGEITFSLYSRVWFKVGFVVFSSFEMSSLSSASFLACFLKTLRLGISFVTTEERSSDEESEDSMLDKTRFFLLT